MVDINTIKAKGKATYSERQAFFPMDFNFLLKRQTNQFQCTYCGAFITDKLLSRDHVYPKSKGGNVTTACCVECNDKKRDMLPIQWAIHSSDNSLDISPTLFKTLEAVPALRARAVRRVYNNPP